MVVWEPHEFHASRLVDRLRDLPNIFDHGRVPQETSPVESCIVYFLADAIVDEICLTDLTHQADGQDRIRADQNM